MLKLWTKVRAFTLLESLAAMTILSICTSLFIVLMVSIIQSPSVLNECERVMKFEKDFLMSEFNPHSDTIYELNNLEVMGNDVLVIEQANQNFKWSLWMVLEKK